MRGRRIADYPMELGLAISRLSLKPGETRTEADMACFCNCRVYAIQRTLRIAMRKVRKRLEPFLK
jgi:predicted DNA-binding transcriptional regulator